MLDQGLQNYVNQASRDEIVNNLSTAKTYWSNGQWLSRHNKYRQRCIEQIKKDKLNSPSGSPTKPSYKHLREYIAVSTIVHCHDGWSLLGRAFDAELSGNHETARHLGYYASLRAAMSLLAGDGVGVFNRTHAVVEQSGKCVCFDASGTHRFAWEALSYWASTPAGTDRLLESIRPGSLPLSEWFSHYPSSFNHIVSNWLDEWGLDLARFSSDRESRNMASYRPSSFINTGRPAIAQTVNKVLRFWEMCEPISNGGFPVLDRWILLDGLENIFKGAHPHNRSRFSAKAQYLAKIKTMLAGLHPTDLSISQWENFLSRTGDSSDDNILVDARKNPPTTDIEHSKHVLARATILLRLATGSTSELLAQAGVNISNELNFWIDSTYSGRIGPVTTSPYASSDLWLDIADAIDNIENWLSNNTNITHYELMKQYGSDASMLTSTERAAYWGLGN